LAPAEVGVMAHRAPPSIRRNTQSGDPMSRRNITALAAAVLSAGVAVSALAAPAAQASAPTAAKAGSTSLVSVLTSSANNGGKLDKNWNNYSILTQAVVTVLGAKPKSAVGVLAKGNVALTAFIPTDRAFQTLVKTLTGKSLHSEKAVLGAVAGLGVDTVEAVLLYHVVPGATVTSKTVLGLKAPARLTTAQGQTLKVQVVSAKKANVAIVDKFPAGRNARLIVSQIDINKGNKQIAHGIDRVLLPVASL